MMCVKLYAETISSEENGFNLYLYSG